MDFTDTVIRSNFADWESKIWWPITVKKNDNYDDILV